MSQRRPVVNFVKTCFYSYVYNLNGYKQPNIPHDLLALNRIQIRIVICFVVNNISNSVDCVVVMVLYIFSDGA